MTFNFVFFLNSVLLGVGLAMDAFSVSLSNGLNETDMRVRKMCLVAGTYALFQAVMPMTGWVCVHTIAEYFKAFQKFIPWIALILLLYIGGKMLIEAALENSKEKRGENDFDSENAERAESTKTIAADGEKASVSASETSGKRKKLTFKLLIIQAIATSIDALSVGFTISDYTWIFALIASLIIASVTLVICMFGLRLGKRFGTKLSSKAEILGGLILIGIGVEIFVKGVFF